MSVPVMIHLPIETFKTLERLAESKHMHMRDMIVAALERSVQPRPVITKSGHVAAPAGNTRGTRRIDAEGWQEIRRLRSAGWTVAELAVRYKVSSSTIYKGMSR